MKWSKHRTRRRALKHPLPASPACGEISPPDAASWQPAEIADMGQTIHESGKRLERLIENFLIYSQIELLSADPQRAGALRKKQTQFPRKVAETRCTQHAEAVGRLPDL